MMIKGFSACTNRVKSMNTEHAFSGVTICLGSSSFSAVKLGLFSHNLVLEKHRGTGRRETLLYAKQMLINNAPRYIHLCVPEIRLLSN